MSQNRPIGLFHALCWILLAAPAAGQLPPEATALNNLAARFYSEGSLSRAEPLYQRALAAAEQAPIPDNLGIARIRSNLAALCRRQGRYGEAAAFYATAVELRQKALGPAHPEVAGSVNNLAEIYRLQGRYWEARQALKQALGMLPTDSADKATVLNNLADIECVYGKYAAAEQLLRAALDVLKVDGPQAVRILNNLAKVVEHRGDLREAETLARRALSIASAPADLATSLILLGDFHRREKRDSLAEDMYQRALAQVEKADDGALVAGTAFHQLAKLRTAQGRPGAAEALFRRALSLREKMLGSDHPALAGLLLDYATALRQDRRKSEAAKLETRARALVARSNRDNLTGATIDLRTLLR